MRSSGCSWRTSPTCGSRSGGGSARLRSKVDSGDIVQSVFADLVRGVRDGGWHFAGRLQLEAFLRTDRLATARRSLPEARSGLQREHSLDETPSQSLGDAAQARPSQEAQGREFWEGFSAPARPPITRSSGSG